MGTKQIFALAQVGSYVSDLKILFHLHFGEFWGAIECVTLSFVRDRENLLKIYLSPASRKSLNF